MNKTNKIILALIGTMIAGSISGCGPSERVVFQRPAQPPHVEGYDDRYWEWDEDDGEWEYNSPNGGGLWYYYGGAMFRKSIKSSGFKSTAPKVTTKIGGFGSGFKGGGFGG